MGKEIRWLNEAKTPLEEVNDEEEKIGSNLDQSIIKYKRANNVQQKDNAVADALNIITGTKAGTKLKDALGFGMLTRFMTAFKWASMTEDNLFIRLLQRLFSGYKDAEVITKILSGEKPTANRSIDNKVNQSKLNQNSLNPNAQLTKSAMDKLNNESLNEAPGDVVRRSIKKGSNINKDTISTPERDNNRITAKQYYANSDEAKILDMSPRDLFMILYNGYLNHLYTYEDIINIDNDTNDNSTVRGRDGKDYIIAKSVKDIINKCQNDSNAFTTKGNEVSSTKSAREVSDTTEKIIDTVKKMPERERAYIIRNISDVKPSR